MESVWCPSDDARELSASDVRQELAEDRTLPGVLCGMAFAPDLRDIQSVTLRDRQHLLDLGVDAERLPLVVFGRFSRIEAVADWFSLNRCFSDLFFPILPKGS